MRVILDECLPKRFVRELTGHTVTTVQAAGWSGVKNGALLRQISGSCDAFLTVDISLPSQQQLTGLPFGVVILRAQSNTIAELRPLAPEVLAALERIKPGQVIIVGKA